MKMLLFLSFVILTSTSLKAQVEQLKDFRDNGQYDQTHINFITNVQGTLFFRVIGQVRDINGNILFNYSLWRSNGTTAGTTMVKDFGPYFFDNGMQNVESYYDGSGLPEFIQLNGSILFRASDATHGYELWRSDGTAAGTVLVKDIYPGVESSDPHWLTVMGSNIYFSANHPDSGIELWKSDGTTGGTILLKNIAYLENENDSENGFNLYSVPSSLTAVGNTLYFSANHVYWDEKTNNWAGTGQELWRSDGTNAGTQVVKDIYPGLGGSDVARIAAVGNTIYFQAKDTESGIELWKSDGTETGTVLVKDINPSGDSRPIWMTALGNMVYFQAFKPEYGYELWKSDGTAAVMVKDLVSGINGSYPYWLTVMNNKLYFSAESPNLGYMVLWSSDGTEAGTSVVLNANSSQIRDPYWLTVVGSTLYFRAEGIEGIELWKSDGTEAGTSIVQDINPSGDSWPNSLAAIGNILYFSATTDASINSYSLWKYTPTNLNTAPVMAAIEDKTAAVGSNLSFTVSASDSDIPAQTLTYSASNLPLKATFNAETRTFSWTPKANQTGEHFVTFHVSDGSSSVSKEVKITVVKATGIKPSISSFTPTSGSFETAVTITGRNLGGAAVTFNGISAPVVSNSSTTIETRVPDGATSGKIAVITLGGTATSKQSFTVTSPSIASALQASEPTGVLFEAYPNPFSGTTTVVFSLSEGENYALEIFDMRGALVKRLAAGTAESNKVFKFELTGKGMAEGIYITRLITSSRSQNLKVILRR